MKIIMASALYHLGQSSISLISHRILFLYRHACFVLPGKYFRGVALASRSTDLTISTEHEAIDWNLRAHIFLYRGYLQL